MGGLVDDPSRKSNCCALTCCGVFLYDRTNYVVTGNRPNWKQRRILYLLVPFVLLMASAIAATAQTLCVDPSDGSQCQTDNSPLILQFVLVLYLILLCAFGHRKHANLRQVVHQKMRGDDNDPLPMPDEIALVAKPTGCCSCYGYDVVLVDDDDDGNGNGNGDGNNASHEDPDTIPLPGSGDLSTWLFKAWSSVCCGRFLNCWCQCCGMCAIGQEDRELELLLRREDKEEALRIDYITFQPYSEYFPGIHRLQTSGDESLKNHYASLSSLSKKILRYALYVVAITSFLFLVEANAHAGMKIAVSLGVWAQPCVILYFVWWRNNRSDISLDAVVKYFASGYVIGVFQAMLVEMLLLIPYSIFLIHTLLNESGKGPHDQAYWEDHENLALTLKRHIGINSFYIFVFCFGIAAFAEELVKYYCFWTVETPEQIHTSNKSKASQTNYITIGMVSAALGFACKENYKYVFQSKDVGVVLVTFLLRSLLAIHPVCAAIQSIGIAKRDVLGDGSWSMGRSLFPAIMLHGTYDFVQIILAYHQVIDQLEGATHVETIAPSSSAPSSAVAGPTTISFTQVGGQFGVGSIFMVSGLVYYFYNARQLRKLFALSDDMETTSLELNAIV